MNILTQQHKDDLGVEIKSTLMKFIGTSVSKRSNKPFKSGSVVNTIKDVVVHPNINRLGFSFEEDDSVVECWRCVTVD
jgi:hypothetical protein